VWRKGKERVVTGRESKEGDEEESWVWYIQTHPLPLLLHLANWGE